MRRIDKNKNMLKVNMLNEQRHLTNKGVLNEISADKVMGAAKKMWQDKIGGNDQMENPRAKKMLTDYANKLKGLQLCDGEIRFTKVDLVPTNNGQAFYLYFSILLTNTASINGFSGFYYNYTTDRIMLGDQLNDSVRPIEEFTESNLTKHDARQLYKVAKHFNPNTRYVNYTREIPYKS